MLFLPDSGRAAEQQCCNLHCILFTQDGGAAVFVVHSDACASARFGAEPITFRCNYAVADQPDWLRSAISLANNGGRPTETQGNVIRGNIIAHNTCTPFEKK